MEFYGYDEQGLGLLEELLTTATTTTTTTNDNFSINGCNHLHHHHHHHHQLDYLIDDYDYCNSIADLFLIPQTQTSFNFHHQGSSNFNNNNNNNNIFLFNHDNDEDENPSGGGFINNYSSTNTTSSSSSSFNELLLYTPSFTTSDDLLLLSSSPSPPPPPPPPAPPAAPLLLDNDDFEEITPQFRPSCKMEPITTTTKNPHQWVPAVAVAYSSNSGGGEVVLTERMSNNNKSKKIKGQPSKNLMAERRRRKRLNDRLSMLRSVVPKISKMDRTSILGDTIDYMKELIERIHHLQEESSSNHQQQQPNLMGIFEDSKPNEALVRNSPKFEVERRKNNNNSERTTRIEIYCGGKTGLLLSTLTTLEALGLEIQHCVISCFNDFSLHASCSQEKDQMEFLSSEDIKQALFRNAGYGGRCL